MLDTETVLAKKLDWQAKPPGGVKAYGAYIGGYSTVSTINLVGISSLEQYTGQYRQADSSVKTAYDKAKTVTEAVETALYDASKAKAGKYTIGKTAINLTFPDIADASSPPKALPAYQSGKLFKSYHGMIKALVHFQTDISQDKDGVTFEIALSPDTTKISSCFPCCTFMTSVNHPPTSTHLGRGDNWNIPSECSSSRRASWEANIKKWYQSGYTLCPQTVRSGALASLAPTAFQAEHFLEALTFESSFTKKVAAVLPP